MKIEIILIALKYNLPVLFLYSIVYSCSLLAILSISSLAGCSRSSIT